MCIWWAPVRPKVKQASLGDVPIRSRLQMSFNQPLDFDSSRVNADQLGARNCANWTIHPESARSTSYIDN